MLFSTIIEEKHKRSYTYVHTHSYEHAHAHPAPMRTFEKQGRQILALVIPKIKLENCEHPYQIDDLNSVHRLDRFHQKNRLIELNPLSHIFFKKIVQHFIIHFVN